MSYSLPFSQFTAGISDVFPKPFYKPLVETGLSAKRQLTVHPSHIAYKQELSQRVLEYRIPSLQAQFLDLTEIVLHLNLNFTKQDGATKLAPNDNLYLTNNFLHSLFKGVSIYMNGVQVENSAYFNYLSYIKALEKLSKENVDYLGRTLYIRNESNTAGGVPMKFTDAFFSDKLSAEHAIELNHIKASGISLTAPLLFDIASVSSLMLDGVEIVIRLEFANTEFFLNSVTQQAKMFVNDARLLVTTYDVQPNALKALQTPISSQPVEYPFTRHLAKSYILNSNQTSVVLDNPFQNTIPERIKIAVIDMAAMQGSINANPLYFEHIDQSRITISVNSSNVYDIRSDFTSSNVTELYYATLHSLGMDGKHLIDFPGFSNGKHLQVYDLTTIQSKESVHPEVTGNLRISITFKTPPTSPKVILVFAETLAVLEVDADRNISINSRG